MSRIAIVSVVGIVALGAAPSFGQIVVPNLSPPPCSGSRCPQQVRDARLPPATPQSIQKKACPPGTVYNPSKGTCKVLPTSAAP